MRFRDDFRRLCLYVGKRYLNTDLARTRTYVQSSNIRKLHLGCGSRRLPGWLNADFHPRHKEIHYLDARRPFPLPDAAFDYAFSEHMLEHLAFEDGQGFLRECFRVLRPGGVLRISTPDLDFIVGLRKSDLDATEQAYLAHSFQRISTRGKFEDAAFAINHAFRAWGHLFLYGESTLNRALAEQGFRDIVRVDALGSAHPELRNLENVDRKPAGIIARESLIMECRKP